jgi:hypothetical protein
MTKFTLFLGFLSILILSSCSDERLLENKMRKMDGNWRYHKVNFKADSKLFSQNLTDEFDDVEWVFTEAGSVMQIDHSVSDTSFGSFELELFKECDDYDGDCENIYFVHLYMINGQNVDHFVWEEARIRNQKLVAKEFVHKGRYEYVLRKF